MFARKEMIGFESHGARGILIPSALKTRIAQEEREAQNRELDQLAQESRLADEERRKKDALAKSESAPSKPKALDYEQERERLLELVLGQLDFDPASKYQVYEPLAPLTLIKRHAPPGQEDKQRNGDIYRALLSKGPVRRLAGGTENLQELDALEHAMPHMREVIAFVRSQIQLGRANKDGLYIPPILLAGEPGVGKTHFAQELASLLGLPMHLQSMDTDVTNTVFLGLDKKWSNSQMGVLFELIGMGQYANPMLILDELDKASLHHSGGPATQSLHSLLEPVSARRVRDISLEIEFDASRVIWIATANEPQRIAAPLRSRFKEFCIQQPSAADAIQMAKVMVTRLVPELAPANFQIPGRTFIVQMAHLSAREIYQTLQAAIAKAVVNERMHLLPSDLPAELEGEGA
jgi:ATP-dependent Lon protease